MATSSDSEFKCSYDIFLSFRGKDTRNKFTDHLYEALNREGFKTFRDREGIKRGKDINSELQKAIWNSSMSVIVLSKTYATSTSCLFEIQTILEHRKKSNHVIFPVFYEVEPSEIKEQANNLDFRAKKVTDEEVKGWSAVLKEVARMCGFVYGNNRSEAKFIEEIIGVLKSKQADKHVRNKEVQSNFIQLGRQAIVKEEVQSTCTALVEELNKVERENKKLTEKLTVLCENYIVLKSHLLDNMSKYPLAGEEEQPVVSRKRKAESTAVAAATTTTTTRKSVKDLSFLV